MGQKFIERGIVYKISGNSAWIELAASSKCEHCEACQILSAGKRGVEAENQVGAGVGDEVEVEICQETRVVFPLLVFGLPVIFLILGIFLGGLVSETASIIFGAVFLLLGFLIVVVVDKYVAGQKKFRNVIVRKVP